MGEGGVLRCCPSCHLIPEYEHGVKFGYSKMQSSATVSGTLTL